MEEKAQYLQDTLMWLMPIILVLIIWEFVWKFIAMWRAGRNNQLAWFICLAVINTAGILPIVYLLTHRKKETDQTRS
jgi:hypothetical protein